MDLITLIRECKSAAENPHHNNTITFVVPGKWSNRGYKKVFGIKGEQIAEYDDGVLTCFPAKELLEAVLKQLPTFRLK